MKRVCAEREGRGNFATPLQKVFQRRVISLEIEKRFRRFPVTFSSSSSSTCFPFRNPKGKVFNVVHSHRSKKVSTSFSFRRSFLHLRVRKRSKGKVFDGLIVIIGKKDSRRRLHFGSRKKVNFEDPNEEALSALSSFNW